MAAAAAFRQGTFDCEQPVEMRYRGAPDPVRVGLGIEKDTVAVAYAKARCRRCQPCLYHRRRLWTARAMAECAVAPRTWFGTLTFRPEERISILYRAQLRYERSALESWSKLGESEQHASLVREASPRVTRWLKRVRKESRASFRYLLVSEAHKDGMPHFHLLLHEKDTSVTKRCLDGNWRDGFSQFRLVDVGSPLGARYVCKYLSKSALTRVRASQRYGQASALAGRVTELTEKASNLIEKLSQDQMVVPGPSP